MDVLLEMWFKIERGGGESSFNDPVELLWKIIAKIIFQVDDFIGFVVAQCRR